MLGNIHTIRFGLLISIFAGLAGAAAEPAINGEVSDLGPCRQLTVWGTPQEMGYAHGYHFAERIESIVDHRASFIGQTSEATYDQIVDAMIPRIQISKRTRAELAGMLEGMAARLQREPLIKSANRPMRIDDLIFRNSEDMIRGLACSGFTVWDERAGDAGVLTARNFDYAVRDVENLGAWMILVRKPQGKKQVATITFPCYLGAFTGFSSEGVCAFMHDGSGGRDQRVPKAIPLALLLKDLLEDASAEDALELAEKTLRTGTPSPFPYMARIISPVASHEGRPVRVFRVDGAGLGENPVGNSFCVTTNHYLSDQFTAPPGTHPWSTSRYAKLSSSLNEPVSMEACWARLDSVSIATSRLATLHSLVVAPRSKQAWVGFAQPGGDVQSATKTEPLRITFDKLFGAQQ